LLDFSDSFHHQISQEEVEENSSQPTKIDSQFQELREQINLFKEPLNNELKKLLEKFIEVKKESIKKREDKQIRKQTGELKKQLREKGFLEEKMDEIIRYCEKLVELEQRTEQKQLQVQVEVKK